MRWVLAGRVSLLAVVLSAVACGAPLTPPSSGDETPPERDDTGLAVTAAEEPPGPVTAAAWVQTSATGNTGPLQVYTDPGDIPYLRMAEEPDQKLPLEHTHVKASLTGFVAEVEVSQTYTNPHADPIEAVYVFPLPENSAVNHMRMVIGERIVEAEIKERGEARRIYTEAKREGYTAALLEQERPNIFTQSVANIEPGKKIDVVIRYVQDLTYDAGQYEFVFPMVVGPRFMPGAKLAAPAAGTGTHADTSGVPDASRISPPIVGKGQRSGHDISLELVADHSLAVSDFDVPTHEVAARKPADGTLQLALAEKESLPNRDFVLRYRVAGPKPKATLFASKGNQGGYFSLIIHPPALDVDALVGQREIIFVVDVSGSMYGVPLGMCRSAMRRAIRSLRPVDTFNILTFSGSTEAAFPTPRPANTTAIREALAIVDDMQAGGGTMMADAVGAALSPEVAAGRHRYVFFMTDGFVGNEAEIISASASFVEKLASKGQRARVFGFGVGSSVNRYLIDGLSRAGKGIAVYSTTREDPARAVNRFYHYVDRAVLTNVKVDWAGLTPRETFPAQIPDLFASHPIILHGRYAGSSAGPLKVHATVGDEAIEIPITVRQAEAKGDAHEVQGALWARSKITDLEEHLWDGASPGVEREITKLGLDFHLVTRFTSFVAVDTSRRVGPGDPQTVVQPVEAPEGVDVEMAGGVHAGPKPAIKPAPPPSPGYPSEMHKEEPTSAPVAESSYGGEYDEDDGADMLEVESRRGCGCRVVGGHPRSVDGLWAVVIGSLILLVRTRRRRDERCRARRPMQ